MIITRTINGEKTKTELTRKETHEACGTHFALQNEEFIRRTIYECERFDSMTDEEKGDLIKDAVLKLAEEYPKDNGFDGKEEVYES